MVPSALLARNWSWAKVFGRKSLSQSELPANFWEFTLQRQPDDVVINPMVIL
jgi:hypothetical protein